MDNLKLENRDLRRQIRKLTIEKDRLDTKYRSQLDIEEFKLNDLKQHFKTIEERQLQDKNKLYEELRTVKTVLRTPYLTNKLRKSKYKRISQ
mmetsp:Transcript_4698/g.4394  ORF Transcript_4698/g.4394 Transcript_4698/m.4394 type:complete len:92 (+) Transcript_4698:147-422(+)